MVVCPLELALHARSLPVVSTHCYMSLVLGILIVVYHDLLSQLRNDVSVEEDDVSWGSGVIDSD